MYSGIIKTMLHTHNHKGAYKQRGNTKGAELHIKSKMWAGQWEWVEPSLSSEGL